MTIDEAIVHAREVAEIQRKICGTHIFFNNVTFEEFYADDTEFIEKALYEHELCAEEHEQLAKWLEDYKKLLEFQKNCTFDNKVYCYGFDEGYEKGRADAIDEFQEWLKTRIVGLDRSNKEVLVVGNDDRWWSATGMYNAICKGMSEDEIIKEFEEQLKNDAIANVYQWFMGNMEGIEEYSITYPSTEFELVMRRKK